MNIISITKKYGTRSKCYKYLEKLSWGRGKPVRLYFRSKHRIRQVSHLFVAFQRLAQKSVFDEEKELFRILMSCLGDSQSIVHRPKEPP